jgi:hypothetical protein
MLLCVRAGVWLWPAGAQAHLCDCHPVEGTLYALVCTLCASASAEAHLHRSGLVAVAAAGSQ